MGSIFSFYECTVVNFDFGRQSWVRRLVLLDLDLSLTCPENNFKVWSDLIIELVYKNFKVQFQWTVRFESCLNKLKVHYIWVGSNTMSCDKIKR